MVGKVKEKGFAFVVGWILGRMMMGMVIEISMVLIRRREG